MKSLWLENQLLSYRDNVREPEICEGEAIIRVHITGICATDLELVKGYYPYTGIPGHEFVGEVVAAPGNDSWIGKRVVGEINAVCGKCIPCKNGYQFHCERRTVLGIVNRNGAFAEYLSLPVENLYIVPDNLTDEQAVFTEPLAAALEIQAQIHISPTDRVLLIGAGRFGQLIAQSIKLIGCDLSVVTRYAHQAGLLVQVGIKVIDTNDIPTRMMDIVIEATGTPNGFILARQAVRPRGVIILKSTYKGEIQIDISSIVVDEISLLGSRCGPFPPALNLLSAGLINPLPLIMKKYSIEEGQIGFHEAAQPGCFKVLIYPGGIY